MMLAKAPDSFLPVAQSAMSPNELETRIIEVAADRGLISDVEYQATLSQPRSLLPLASGAPVRDAIASSPDSLANHRTFVQRQDRSALVKLNPPTPKEANNLVVCSFSRRKKSSTA